jgi:RNA polymerase sigma factor (sigma-70 family)
MSLDALLAASRSGEPEARRALIDALYHSLRGFFRRHCSSFDAEDLVQTTILRILPKIDGFEPRHSRSFEALVFMTAGRVLFTKQRSWSRERARFAESLAAMSVVLALDTSVTGRLARREVAEQVLAKIDELEPVDQRTIHYWLAEVGWREQAELERVARATLRSRLQRAVGRLRQLLGQPEFTRPDPEPSTT